MDGTTKDSFANGQLFRPASYQYAIENYPEIIYGLAKYRLTSSPSTTAADGLKHVIIENKPNNFVHHMRIEDFELCKVIIEKIGSIPLFLSEPKSDVIGRIRAQVSLQFANRNRF